MYSPFRTEMKSTDKCSFFTFLSPSFLSRWFSLMNRLFNQLFTCWNLPTEIKSVMIFIYYLLYYRESDQYIYKLDMELMYAIYRAVSAQICECLYMPEARKLDKGARWLRDKKRKRLLTGRRWEGFWKWFRFDVHISLKSAGIICIFYFFYL